MSDRSFILNLHVEGRTIPVEVTRKRVKNLNLRVRADGTVALSIPSRASIQDARSFLDRKASWVCERVMRARARGTDIHGGVQGPRTHIALWGEAVPLEDALGGYRDIEELYKAEVQQRLPGLADMLEQRIGVHATRWSVRMMKSRWGSCTPRTGAMRINAKLAAYPPICLEFVVAHELVHLLEPSHNARFHALLDRYCPHARATAQILRRAASN